MKKVLVLYGSKYGTTMQYAVWIAEELGADVKDVNNTSAGDAAKYEVIILGGGLYAGGVKGLNFLTKNYNELSNKNWIVFTCGLADPNIQENINNIRNNIHKKFTPQMRENIKLFHLRGGIDYKELTFIHSLMMSMLKRVIKKKKPNELTDENRSFIKTYGKKVNFVNKKTVNPIIDYVKNLESNP